MICYTLISFSLYNLYTKKVLKKQMFSAAVIKKSMLALGHMKTYVGPVTSHLRHAMTRLTSQASRFVLNPLFSETNSSKVVSICCSQSG